ncbi:MAG: UDP-glucose 4-epimerase GalE [Alphaproteobacteria bacterium]
MSVLVTGGAGYIGSHMALRLAEAGERTVVLDNLSTGARCLVPDEAEFVEGDVGDRALLDRLFGGGGIEAVLHFAGSIVVPESVARPLAYYENNTAKSRTLIEACVAHEVKNFIFSSTAVVYDEAAPMPLSEESALGPISPYGTSKLMTEWMLRDAARAHDLRYAVLRYFNVAGADPAGRSGQVSPQATHLIKVASRTALGAQERLTIFGTDYPTADGTCVRDYVHVSDLVEAHLLALDHLRGGGASCVYNCGYGRGVSVREVLRAVEAVTGDELPVEEGARRAGDPPSLIADATRLRTELGWRPAHDDLQFIVRTAMKWERGLAEKSAHAGGMPSPGGRGPRRESGVGG